VVSVLRGLASTVEEDNHEIDGPSAVTFAGQRLEVLMRGLLNCRRILARIADAGSAAARLVIVEGLVPSGDGPHVTKTLDLVMLVLVTGCERTFEEVGALLRSGGTASRGSRAGLDRAEAAVVAFLTRLPGEPSRASARGEDAVPAGAGGADVAGDAAARSCPGERRRPVGALGRPWPGPGRLRHPSGWLEPRRMPPGRPEDVSGGCNPCLMSGFKPVTTADQRPPR
jgi:hypothetical protein